MTPKSLRFTFFILTVIFACCLLANAQRRDYLTEAEIELVREAQAIDLRTEVFIKAIDRRFLVINNQAAPTDKKSKKDAEKWGEMPSGTRLQLFTDIKRILDAAIENVNDTAAHDKKDDKLFPKAVRALAAASARYLPELQADLNKTTDEKEKGVILSSIEFCRDIIEASAKVPK